MAMAAISEKPFAIVGDVGVQAPHGQAQGSPLRDQAVVEHLQELDRLVQYTLSGNAADEEWLRLLTAFHEAFTGFITAVMDAESQAIDEAA